MSVITASKALIGHLLGPVAWELQQTEIRLRSIWYGLHCPLTRAALRNMPASQLFYGVNISPYYRYVYIDNPKTGCSSLKSALMELEAQKAKIDLDFHSWKVLHDRQVSPLLELTDLNHNAPLSHLVNSGFRFVTFVRNPYSRLLSCYRDRILNNREQKKKVLALLGYKPADREMPISFDQFVKVVVGQADYEMDPHWRLQVSHVLHDILPYSFVGRFEQYEKDYYALFEHLGIEANIPAIRHLNKSKKNAQEELSEFYTEELRDLVYQRYFPDFEAFGYSRELLE